MADQDEAGGWLGQGRESLVCSLHSGGKEGLFEEFVKPGSSIRF